MKILKIIKETIFIALAFVSVYIFAELVFGWQLPFVAILLSVPK